MFSKMVLDRHLDRDIKVSLVRFLSKINAINHAHVKNSIATLNKRILKPLSTTLRRLNDQ